MTVNVSVNGAGREFTAETNIADVVAVVTPTVTGVAVAVNGEVVPRTDWSATPLCEGDQVEVLTAAQGG